MPCTNRWLSAALGVLLCAMPGAAQAPSVTVVKDLDYVATVEYPDGKDRLDVFWVDKEGVGPDRPTYVWGPDQKIWVESSPARYLRADLPPVLILDTDGDERWRQHQNVDLAAALRAAGHKDVTVHKVRGRTHMSVWTRMNDSPSEETSSQILLFARRVFAAKGE